MWSAQKGPTRLWDLTFLFLILQCTIRLVLAGNEIWPLERPDGMPNIVSLEVMCGKDHMDVHLSFSHPFEGIVSSKGQHSDPRCVYVPPSTGKTFFSFRIAYARCGTKPDLHGQFYENTVVVQYDKDLLEVWDEAKRLRCEWFNDYEKTASKPPMVIADLDVIQLDFRGDNVDCWMEIQHGKGPWAPPVSGIVPLGSTLTLVVAINDYRGEFDMRVKSCLASDGAGHIIKLSDEYGCVLRPKMISRFLKARAPDERATVITYAFFHAFKFPDALSVHIKCKVEICRHGCLDHCQLSGNIHERKDTNVNSDGDSIAAASNEINMLHENSDEDDSAGSDGGDVYYDDIIHNGNDMAAIGGIGNQLGLTQMQKDPSSMHHHSSELLDELDKLFGDQPMSPEAYKQKAVPPPQSSSSSSSESQSQPSFGGPKPVEDKFPHGPRYFEAQNRLGKPAVAGPRSLDMEDDPSRILEQIRPVYKHSHNDNDEDAAAATADADDDDDDNNGKVRRKRSIVISDRKARSADVGVSGIYEVISEADLAFSPDTKQEAVTVFQGKISEEVVYGICMPVPGFSVLFILVTSAAIVSALVAGSLLYRYQLQKEVLAHQQKQQSGGNMPETVAANTIASWMTLRLFRMRQHNNSPDGRTQ